MNLSSICKASALALTLLLPASVYAFDGTVTINGRIVDTTCTINDGDPNRIVNLPTIGTSALKTAGDTAGHTPFTLELTNCPTALNDQPISAYFEPSPTTDRASGNLRAFTAVNGAMPTTGAQEFTNAQIQILGQDLSKIIMGESATTQNTPSTQVVNQAATLRYVARYARTGNTAPGAGTLVTFVNYSIVYP